MKKNNLKNIDLYDFIESHIIDIDISYRGGTLKIDVSELFDTGEEAAIMGAYQNYLGGGIAGSIQTGRMFSIESFTNEEKEAYEKISEELKKYFYNVNNGGGDEYMQENITGEEAGGFDRLQKLPVSAY